MEISIRFVDSSHRSLIAASLSVLVLSKYHCTNCWYAIVAINTVLFFSTLICLSSEELEHLNGKVAFLSTPSIYFSLSSTSREICHVLDVPPLFHHPSSFHLILLPQYDKKWMDDRGYVFYDYNSPDEIPSSLMNTFDVVVIDPPFITHEVNIISSSLPLNQKPIQVWAKYAKTAKLLLKTGIDDQGKTSSLIVFLLSGLDRKSNWEGDRNHCPRECSAAPRPLECDPYGGLHILCPLTFLALSQVFQPSIPNLVYQYHLFANYPSLTFSKPNPEIPE
jgi:EEF1A lysine methyltransferase 1